MKIINGPATIVTERFERRISLYVDVQSATGADRTEKSRDSRYRSVVTKIISPLEYDAGRALCAPATFAKQVCMQCLLRGYTIVTWL